jgi:flagellar protein FlgJ
MTSPIAGNDVYTDFQGLSELRSRARNNSEDTLREVAGQFEALFIQMMLKSMRDAGLGEGLLDSEHTKTYQTMFDKQISIDLSKGKGLGLAEMMVRQLSRAGVENGGAQPELAPQSPTFQALVPPTAGVRTAVQTSGAPAANSDWSPDSPQAFVTQLWPHAERTARSLRIAPEALIAQAALETGWGKHVMRRADGHSSFNLFGIKADARWTGERVTSETIEFRDGLMRKERATFRAYASLAEGLADYANFLQSNPRYQEALNKAGDAVGFAQALAAAGYATDPEYASKINKIISGDPLRRAVAEIKESGT